MQTGERRCTHSRQQEDSPRLRYLDGSSTDRAECGRNESGDRLALNELAGPAPPGPGPRTGRRRRGPTAILCLSALIHPLPNRLFADPNPVSLCNLGRALRLGSDPKKL